MCMLTMTSEIVNLQRRLENVEGDGCADEQFKDCSDVSCSLLVR